MRFSFSVFARGEMRGRAVLDLLHDNDHCPVLFMRLGIAPYILIQAAHEIDAGTLFQLHFFDAFAYGTEGFHGKIDPMLAAFRSSIIGFLADPETDGAPVFGIMESGGAVVAFGDEYIGCNDF